MRRSCASLAALAITLMSLLAAGPAWAGGPTSVLLVLPGTGQTASLYTGDPDYEALADLVGAFEPSGAAGTVDPSGTSHDSGPAVTLTWLIHDVTVWRVDRVYFDADGGPWISTQTATGESSSIWDSPVAWHTAVRGKALAALLDRLGVGRAAPTPAAAAVAEQSLPLTGQRAGTGTSRPVWWVSGLSGLAVGVVLTMIGMRLSASSRTGGDPAHGAVSGGIGVVPRHSSSAMNIPR